MKKIAIPIGLVALLLAALAYNVWHGSNDPVVTNPGPLEIGRQKLHAQLEESKQREAQIEKQDWDSIPLLRQLIQSHQHRIDALTGNNQAGEIVAHDHEAIDRLQKRIDALEEQEAAKAAQQKEAAKQAAQQ